MKLIVGLLVFTSVCHSIALIMLARCIRILQDAEKARVDGLT